MKSDLVNQIVRSSQNDMSNVFRYSTRRVVQRESLAEHCYFVALIADEITEDILKYHPELIINREKVLRFALVHDFEEVVTGDVVNPPKYRSDILRKELEKVGQEMLEETLKNDFEGNDHISNMILKSNSEYEEFKYDKLENSIVKLADMIQALTYSKIETESGNFAFNEIVESIKTNILSKFKDHEILGKYALSVM